MMLEPPPKRIIWGLAIALGIVVLLCVAGCVPAGGDGCAWTRPFVPDDGFEARWTVGEKRQAVAHNRAWREFCE
jgi:hypothetical protein